MQWNREEIWKLSVAERLQLVEDIWDSIAQENASIELTEAQVEDVDRRIAELERDPGSTKTWSEVRERLERGE
jgi:putative addiction module component (TIGR02574 family)